jgi:nucleotide-binding universal stress UspA family protein
MKTYLVPVDFSGTSIHAAEFAALLSKQTDVKHIVLLHSYHVSVYESVLPTPDMTVPTAEEIEEHIGEKTDQLEHIKASISKLAREGVKITVRVSSSALVRAIIETIDTENGDLVILGSNGADDENDSYVGSNVVGISRLSPVPIIVVPPACHYEPIKRIVMACDFQKVKDTFPLQALKKLMSRHKFDLLVVNIDPSEKHKDTSPLQLAEETVLFDMLEEYHPEYFYHSNTDIINGILNFAAEQRAQLVIALPHNYSFFQSIIHNSVSHRLTIQSDIPVLLLKRSEPGL